MKMWGRKIGESEKELGTLKTYNKINKWNISINELKKKEKQR